MLDHRQMIDEGKVNFFVIFLGFSQATLRLYDPFTNALRELMGGCGSELFRAALTILCVFLLLLLVLNNKRVSETGNMMTTSKTECQGEVGRKKPSGWPWP